MKRKSSYAIWCAPISASPPRARTEAATRKHAKSAAVRTHLFPARPARRRVWAEELDDERDPHSGLRDRGSGRAAGDPPVEAVDEEQLEDEVRDVRDDDDLERPAEVRDAAQVALAGQRDERGG